MLQETDIIRKSPLSWRLFFGLKLVFDLALTGIFYFENSITIFWRLSFIVFSLMAFLVVNLFYLRMKKHKNWLFHLLIIDFLVSASYGYIYIGGNFPNHLFIGITALAILMFLKLRWAALNGIYINDLTKLAILLPVRLLFSQVL